VATLVAVVEVLCLPIITTVVKMDLVGMITADKGHQEVIEDLIICNKAATQVTVAVAILHHHLQVTHGPLQLEVCIWQDLECLQ
jgi:hypothetical protein